MPDDHELPDNGYIRTQKATSYGGVGLNGKKIKKNKSASSDNVSSKNVAVHSSCYSLFFSSLCLVTSLWRLCIEYITT